MYESVIKPNGGQKKQIAKLLKLFVTAFAFYFVWSGIICPIIDGSSVKEALVEQFSLIAVIKLMLLNAPTYGYHLWYLLTLIYVLILSPVMDSCLPKRLITVMCFTLMGVSVIMPWACNFLNIPFRNEFVRNFLFEGLPLFYTGCWMIKESKSLLSMYKERGIITLLGLAFFILLIIERRIYGLFNISTPVTVMAFILASYFVFVALCMNEKQCENRYFKVLAKCGGITTDVYIIHLWVFSLMKSFGAVKAAMTAFVCFLVSLLIAVAYRKLLKQRLI